MVTADIAAVVAVERDVYPFPWTAGNFRDALACGYPAWVLGNERLVGYALMMHALDEVHLLNLSVARAYQRDGHGRWLLRWLCGAAAADGAARIFLEVRPSNLPARRLYESEGFEQVGVRKGYYPSWNDTREDAWVLRRALDDYRQHLPRAQARIHDAGPV